MGEIPPNWLEDLHNWAEALATAMEAPARRIIDTLTVWVDDVNAQGGYFTDDGREIGYFEHLEYQKWKVHHEIALLRAELVEQ